MSARTVWILFLATLVVAVFHMVWAHGVLPARVASHFGADGVANGWSSRIGFIIAYASTMAVMAVTFGGFSLLLPRVPDSVLSLPRRDYWLAPERRDATRRRFTAWYLLMGVVTNLFLIITMHLTVRENLGPGEPHLEDTFWLCFGAYMLFVLVWTVWFVASYAHPPAGGP